MSQHPFLISHRTQMGTQPENTLAGISAAIAAGVDGVEIDVRATRDGVPVLLHDASLARTTGDPRPLASVTAAIARRLHVRGPDGVLSEERVPSLAAALSLVAGRCLLVIEVKDRGLGRSIARRVRAVRGAAWCWVWSFDAAAVAECRAALSEVPASLLVAPPSSPAVMLTRAVRAGCAGVSLHHSLTTETTVLEAHRRGLAVYSWTVDDRSLARQLHAADVDAICSNVPERVAPVLRRRAG